MFARALEFVAVFFVLPGVIAFWPIRVNLIAVMWGLALVCLFVLWRDAGFDRRRLWNAAAITRRDLAWVLGRYVVLAAVLAGVLWLMRGKTLGGLEFPEVMFPLPRRRPGLWAFIMVAYPLLSVLPQNVVWRAFIFRRYGPVFGGPCGVEHSGGWAMVIASAVAFGWAHVVMLNWFAVATTLVGGVLFARTYRRSGSMLLASIEHALYGGWMFTVGYGLLFLYGELPPPPEVLDMLGGAAAE